MRCPVFVFFKFDFDWLPRIFENGNLACGIFLKK